MHTLHVQIQVYRTQPKEKRQRKRKPLIVQLIPPAITEFRMCAELVWNGRMNLEQVAMSSSEMRYRRS